jgi:hypothetical protein
VEEIKMCKLRIALIGYALAVLGVVTLAIFAPQNPATADEKKPKTTVVDFTGDTVVPQPVTRKAGCCEEYNGPYKDLGACRQQRCPNDPQKYCRWIMPLREPGKLLASRIDPRAKRICACPDEKYKVK